MNKALLDKAINNLAIHDVYLSSSTIDVKNGFIPELQTEPLLIQFKNSIQGSSLAKIEGDENFKALLIYHYDVGFRALPQGLSDEIMANEELLKNEILAEVTATFNASYYAKEILDDDEMMEFGFSNVGFNVWPYWREYASSIANRIRLPHFIVPLKRVNDIKEPTQ
ncbi:MAG TPA: hypothetical protein ENJ60_09655 [Aeromonadales bacterium]|nr:hypothetical protein [Aeromonadales bacterium]